MPNLWEPDGEDSVAVRKQFRDELKVMIDQHVSSPSIVMWVPFNENWGAFEVTDITAWVKKYDPNRWVNGMSGYNYAPGYRKTYGDPEMEISWICIIMARSSLRRSPVPMINVLRPLANSEEKVYLCVGICGLYAMTLMR